LLRFASDSSVHGGKHVQCQAAKAHAHRWQAQRGDAARATCTVHPADHEPGWLAGRGSLQHTHHAVHAPSMRCTMTLVPRQSSRCLCCLCARMARPRPTVPSAAPGKDRSSQNQIGARARAPPCSPSQSLQRPIPHTHSPSLANPTSGCAEPCSAPPPAMAALAPSRSSRHVLLCHCTHTSCRRGNLRRRPLLRGGT